MSYNENKAVTELHEQQADIALDAVDSLPAKMIALADAVTRLPGMEYLSAHDWNDFIGTIEMAWDDLFAKERERLMQIAGYRPAPKSQVIKTSPLVEILKDSINPNTNPFYPKPTRDTVPVNPETWKEMGFPL